MGRAPGPSLPIRIMKKLLAAVVSTALLAAPFALISTEAVAENTAKTAKKSHAKAKAKNKAKSARKKASAPA